MADYIRIKLSIEISENSDYSDPEVSRTYTATSTADEYFHVKVDADSDGETLDLSLFASVADLVIVNVGAEDGKAAYTDVTDSDAHSLEIGAGKFVKVTDAAPGSDLVLTSASGTTFVVYVFGT